MSGYIMWILLGGLILIVVGFLLFSSIWDRKKNKKIKKHNEKIKQDAYLNISKVAIWITSIIFEVNYQLKKFVPSIGQYKMSEINEIAKNELKKVRNSKEFKTIIIDKELHKSFTEKIDILIKNKANAWNKKNITTVVFWKNQIATSLTTDELKKEHNKYQEDMKKKIKSIYE